ncbi:MAG: hypothetical protein ACI90V_014298 [Bacillariaceae sp.]|jgi:hypothetical protein
MGNSINFRKIGGVDNTIHRFMNISSHVFVQKKKTYIIEGKISHHIIIIIIIIIVY